MVALAVCPFVGVVVVFVVVVGGCLFVGRAIVLGLMYSVFLLRGDAGPTTARGREGSSMRRGVR